MRRPRRKYGNNDIKSEIRHPLHSILQHSFMLRSFLGHCKSQHISIRREDKRFFKLLCSVDKIPRGHGFQPS